MCDAGAMNDAWRLGKSLYILFVSICTTEQVVWVCERRPSVNLLKVFTDELLAY